MEVSARIGVTEPVMGRNLARNSDRDSFTAAVHNHPRDGPVP